MIDLEHSPLGGSSAWRFLTCAFSFLEHRRQLQAGKFVEIPSEYAALGTGAHEFGAVCLTRGTEPFEHFGEAYNGYRVGFDGEINPDAVAVYVNDCRAILQEAADEGPGQVYVERTFHLPEIHPLLKGTVDFAVVTPTKIWLRDYKNGEGVGVEILDNEQALYYAFLLILFTPGLAFESRDLPVNLGVTQPNFYGEFDGVQVWETTLGAVLDWGFDTLLPRMTELMNRDGNYGEIDAIPGDHCQFCPVLLHCPSMQKAFVEYAEADEDFIVMLTDQELDHYYSKRAQARRFMSELEKAVYARKVTGGKIPSAKLVDKKTARVWKPGAKAVLVAAFGEKAFAPKKELSPAGIEKLSSRGMEIAKEWGYKPEAHSLTIAPLSDPRAEAQPKTNSKVFAAFEQNYKRAYDEADF